MNNEFIDALIKMPRPGFNKLEQDWYFDRFQAEAGKAVKLQDLAQTIVKELNEPLETVVKWMMTVQTDPSAMGKLAPWLSAIAKIEDENSRQRSHTQRDMATMIMVSRLPLEWLLSQQENLANSYAVSLSSTDIEELKTLPRHKWLASQNRWELMESVTAMLPGSIIDELADYVLNELRGGAEPKPELAESPEEQIKTPAPDTPNLGIVEAA